MIDRFERGFDRFDRRDGGSGRTSDDDDFDAEQTRGFDLRVGGRTAAILGHDRIDTMFLHQVDLTLEREGAAVEHVFDIRHDQRRIDGINAAHQIEVLWGNLGMVRALPSGRQKDAARGGSKRSDGGRNIRHDMPVVAGFGHPFGPNKRDGAYAAAFGHSRRIGGDALGEGMRGVDQHVVASLRQEARQAFRTAEATDAHRDRLFGWSLGAAGQRQQDVEVPSCGKSSGKVARLARATEDQNTGLVHG